MSNYETPIAQLPLPLAQLYRRARNAVDPFEGHQAAYYSWEMALNLVGTVVVMKTVRRNLINIGTLLFLAALAANLGNLLATRATLLKPDSDLIGRLNELDLPRECRYTSILLRGLTLGIRGGDTAYHKPIDPKLLDDLPFDYRGAGNRMIHVQSTNLRFGKCALQYEAATQRAVHAIVLRLPAPQGTAALLARETIHAVALSSPLVNSWVSKLLADPEAFWTGLEEPDRETWIRWQAQLTVYSTIEAQGLSNPCREITSTVVDKLDCLQKTEAARIYQFAGSVRSRDLLARHAGINGMLRLKIERFGRISRVRLEGLIVTPR